MARRQADRLARALETGLGRGVSGAVTVHFVASCDQRDHWQRMDISSPDVARTRALTLIAGEGGVRRETLPARWQCGFRQPGAGQGSRERPTLDNAEDSPRGGSGLPLPNGVAD